ncbi:hypothetical protein [Ferrovibrio xuzhouensis]|uniref:Uncharacterized protein n=1 Tax=Ferrovibrio xuzhouensis TaxID=1576914 RepID=A0ABV7VBM9_9PROT
MDNGVSAAVTAMEQAVRRLDAALGKRAAAFRSLSDQHGATAAELRALREELQAARDEAASLRERADLVDALREELAQIQNERGEGDMQPVAAGAGDTARHMQLEQAVAARDAEIAALKDERDTLQQRLAAAGSAAMPATVQAADVTTLKAELTAARAAQAEMQAFQSGIAARLEATMARLRQALDAEVAGQR